MVDSVSNRLAQLTSVTTVSAAGSTATYVLAIGLDGDALQMSLSRDQQLQSVGVTESFAERWAQIQHDPDLGALIFDRLIPARIRTFFLNTEAIALQLQVDVRLMTIPWELTRVNGKMWCEQHQVTRTLLAAPTAGAGVSSVTSERNLSAPPVVDRSLRLVTALSYDLVGSTQLMHELGVERYSLLLHETHNRFAALIAQHEGESDPPLGDDGIMCYFGHTASKGGAARQALSAALALIRASRELGVRIRIGVATGQLAVDASHRVGLSVHLAARLQRLAEPGSILTCADTRALAKTGFQWGDDIQLGQVKGFEHPVGAVLLLQEGQGNDQGQWSGLSRWPLVGRRTERDWIAQYWRQALAHKSLMLQVEGDAGIGKSKLMSCVADDLQESHQARVMVFRCSPEAKDRALAPLIDWLERLFQVNTLADTGSRAERLNQALVGSGLSLPEQQVSRLLLGVTLPDGRAPAPLRRREVLDVLVSWVLRQIRQQPHLLWVEDAQWADPSTWEFLDHLARSVRQSGQAGLMGVLTRRTQGEVRVPLPWITDTLKLQPLQAQEAADFIQVMVGDHPLSAQALEVVLKRAEGVPLFVEELTRLVLAHPQGANRSASPLPATLQEVLSQRLDTLGADKPLAQLCSILGREFTWPLLSRLWQHVRAEPQGTANDPETEAADFGLRQSLRQLQVSGVLGAKEQRTESVYYFRHALIEEAAYQSLWQLDRSRLHRQAAQVLEQFFPQLSQDQPALLVHHWSRADDYSTALQWSLKAVRKYKQAEAHQEALAHLQTARLWLERLPDSPQKQKQQLDIELQTAGQLIGVKGYSETQVGQAYRNALAMAHQLNDKKSLLRAQLGIEAYHFVRGDFGQAHAYISQALDTAREFDDALTLAQCQWSVANVLFHQGEVATALKKIDACVSHCESGGIRRDLVQSPEVMARMYGAYCAWELGWPDQALSRGLAAVELAENMKHRMSLGQALGVLAMVHWGRGEYDQVLRTSDRAVTVFEEGDHELWRAQARFMRGFALAALAQPHEMQAGLQQMEQAQADWCSTGAVLTLTYYQTLRAHMLGRAGRVDEALDLMAQTLALIERHGEHYFEPEVWRQKGELLLLQAAPVKGPDPSTVTVALHQALQCFERGLEVARQRQLMSFELRCLTSLARHLPVGPRRVAAAQMLEQCLTRFAHEVPTTDIHTAHEVLRMARTLL